MTELVFFLEEPSAKAMLEGVVPRLLDENQSQSFNQLMGGIKRLAGVQP